MPIQGIEARIYGLPARSLLTLPSEQSLLHVLMYALSTMCKVPNCSRILAR
jgi:hypothetical protein